MAGKLRVEDLLGEVGSAIVTAQSRLLKSAQENPSPVAGVPSSFAISETEIEVKMVFEEDGGATAIRPVTAGSSRLQDLNPGVLSTLRAKILAVPDEEPARPKRTPSDIRDGILRRPDIGRLRKIFGELTVETRFVASAGRWLADVVEPGGKTLRSFQIADEAPLS